MNKYFISIICVLLFSICLVSANLDNSNLFISFDDDDLSGSNPTDASDEGVSLTNNGATTGVTGINNQAFNFDGTNDYVSTGAVDSYMDTVSIWLKPDSQINQANQKAIMGDEVGGIGNFMIWFGEFSGGLTNEMIVLRTSSGYTYWTTGSVASITTDWHNIVIVWNGATSKHKLYYDGVDKGDGTVSIGSARWSGGTVDIGVANTFYFDGSIDNFGVWDYSFTSDDVADIYNDGDGLNPYQTNSNPSVSIVSPVNNTHNNTVLVIDFYYLDGDADRGNCTINISDSEFVTFELNSNVTQNYESNMTSDNNYTYFVVCTDVNGGIGSSSVYTYYYDTTNPIIDWETPDDNLTVLLPGEDMLNVTVDFSDINLYKYLINITFSDGTSYYEYTSDDLTPTSFSRFSELINVSSFPYGRYTIYSEVADSHTLDAIKDYDVISLDSKLIFDTAEKNSIEISSVDDSVVSFNKVVDRYEFSFDFTDKLVKDRVFYVKSENKINYLKNSNYKGHFVIFDSSSLKGNWIDFEGEKGTPVIKKISDYEYSVTFPSVLDVVEFKSIGGLNTANSSLTFVKGREPVINDVSISPVTAYYNNSLNCSFSSYHSDGDDLNVSVYFVDDGVNRNLTTFNNITYNNSYSIGLDSSFVSPNELIYCVVNVSNSYLTVSSSDNITISDYFPVVINYTPDNLSPSYFENESVDFNVSVFDDDSDVWYVWFLDNVVQAFTQAWNWVIGFEESGSHEVMVVVNDSSNQSVNVSWIVTVENVNIVPVVNDLYSLPLVTYQNYGDQNIVCNTSDEDTNTSDLIVEIQYRAFGSVFWTDTTEFYDAVNDLWISTFDPSTVSLGTMDFRCKSNDGNLDSDWYYVYDSVDVFEEQYDPTTPSVLSPNRGNYDYSIIVSCGGSVDYNFNQKLYYEIQYSIDNGSWVNFSFSEKGISFFDVAEKLDYNESVDFRCRAVDSDGFNSSFFNPDGVITRVKSYEFFIFQPSPLMYYMANKPIKFGVLGDFSLIDNVTIKYNYMDCNGDGIWDYLSDDSKVWTNSTPVKSFTEYYWCSLPSGLVGVESGVALVKNSTYWDDSLTMCKDVLGDVCVISKKNVLMVI